MCAEGILCGIRPPLTAYGGALPEGEPFGGSLRFGSGKRNLLEKTARFCPENPYLEIFQKIQIAIFSPKLRNYWQMMVNHLRFHIFRKGDIYENYVIQK